MIQYFNTIPNYQVARTILAFAQLLTFNAGSIKDMFIESRLNNVSSVFDEISIFGIFGYDNLILLNYIISALLILVIFGILPHFTSIFHWWVSFSFLQSAVLVEGGDQVATILCLILIPIIFICNKGSFLFINRKAKISQFSLILLRALYFLVSIQVSYIYFEAGFSKINVIEWSNGSAIYYWFFHNIFGSHIISEIPILTSLIKISYVTCFMTWSVILFEILYSSLALISREKRRKYFIFGVVFHLLIYLFIGLGSFSLAMIAAIILYILPFENYLKIDDESI